MLQTLVLLFSTKKKQNEIQNLGFWSPNFTHCRNFGPNPYCLSKIDNFCLKKRQIFDPRKW